MGKFPVTQAEYSSIAGNNPSYSKDSDHPVTNVHWNDAMHFCDQITKLQRDQGVPLTDWKYVLPTEAQWEYACRSGSTDAFCFGNGVRNLRDFCWYADSRPSGATTQPVGQKQPNPWGLYDMHGNAWELCQDEFRDYSTSTETDPFGVNVSQLRVLRGGSCMTEWDFCRSAARQAFPDGHTNLDIGFRLALVPSTNTSR